MKMSTYTDQEMFPYRIEIDNHLEWIMHYDIARWCRTQFGEHNHCITWRHALSGMPSRNDPEFSTWLFLHEEEAMLFKMVWQDVTDGDEYQNPDSETGS